MKTYAVYENLQQISEGKNECLKKVITGKIDYPHGKIGCRCIQIST